MTTKLPAPKGKYSVACTDVLTSTGVRGNLFRLYYPTDKFDPTEDNLAPWVDDDEYIHGYADYTGLKYLASIIRYLLRGQKIPVLYNGPLISSGEKFPVVVFSHGLGGTRTSNCYVCYSIASYGFIVAAIEHRDQSASATYYLEDSGNNSGGGLFEKNWVPIVKLAGKSGEFKPMRNMQLYKREDEVSCIKDRLVGLNHGNLTNLLSDFDFKDFEGKLDLEKCAVVGHSFGGATVVASLINDRRFKVGVLLDGWLFPLDSKMYKVDIPQPMLFINSESFSDQENIARFKALDATARDPKLARKMITLLGTVHQTQADFTHIIPAWYARIANLRGEADPKLANEVNTEAIVRFIGNALDLPCKGDIDSLVEENEFVIHGTNLKMDTAL